MVKTCVTTSICVIYFMRNVLDVLLAVRIFGDKLHKSYEYIILNKKKKI